MTKLLLALVLLIAGLHYGGLSFDWYHAIWWFDIPLHMLGGAFIGILFLYIFREKFLLLNELSLFPLTILGVGFVMWLGVLWEFYEFFADVFILKHYALLGSPGWIRFDTLKDLLDDMIGGAIAIILFWKTDRR